MDHVATVTDLPLIAAGGIMGPGQVEVALAAGAVAVQCGTAFLRCRESGANPLYKDALVDPRYTTTAMTRAFSGRWARGLVNGFMLDHDDAPAGYPGDQQRHPLAAGRRRGQGRHGTDECGRPGLPVGP